MPEMFRIINIAHQSPRLVKKQRVRAIRK